MASVDYGGIRRKVISVELLATRDDFDSGTGQVYGRLHDSMFAS